MMVAARTVRRVTRSGRTLTARSGAFGPSRRRHHWLPSALQLPVAGASVRGRPELSSTAQRLSEKLCGQTRVIDVERHCGDLPTPAPGEAPPRRWFDEIDIEIRATARAAEQEAALGAEPSPLR